ncbi:MAG: triose-phosphate isomerase [archaeon]
MKPIVVVNFKTYKQGAGVLKLARAIEKVDEEIIVGVQACDVLAVSSRTNLKVFCQHVDWQKPGRGTGFILPEAVKADGAVGVFLNHSEHKLKWRILKRTVRRCREVGLGVLIFASGLREARRVRKLKPDYLVVEPPELVGGKVSVSSRPEFILDLSRNLKCDFLVGAGICSRRDVVRALELGAVGVAVSSGIVRAREPGRVLRRMLTK